jgi:hypothetical protein
MDSKQVREWKAGYEAANRVALDEARNRTPYERLVNHQVFLQRLAAMDKLQAKDPADKFYIRWCQVKERWLERSSRT